MVREDDDLALWLTMVKVRWNSSFPWFKASVRTQQTCNLLNTPEVQALMVHPR
jgi:hypothetical protein